MRADSRTEDRLAFGGFSARLADVQCSTRRGQVGRHAVLPTGRLRKGACSAKDRGGTIDATSCPGERGPVSQSVSQVIKYGVPHNSITFGGSSADGRHWVDAPFLITIIVPTKQGQTGG